MRQRVISLFRNLLAQHRSCHAFKLQDGWHGYDQEVCFGFGLVSRAAQNWWGYTFVSVC